ncbi:MAG TPA: HPF/RaiA family ribosome-associated protein [Candidatus Peribacteraceae bacterium]|nr:HPF/RaiA family ribosome-associated protein [Candidatus Peribacteraceae bacterium]
MNIRHYEKSFTYTDRELLKIARAVGRLATYCQRIKDEASIIHVDAERRSTKKSRDQFKVTIRLELPHKTLTAESRRPDVVEAVDRCVEKLEPQVKRYKDMLMSRRERRQSAAHR